MNPSDDFVFGPNEFGELNGSCQRCGVHYGSAAELKLHFATIHQRQTFECFVCNKLFLQKFHFLAHIDRVHPDLGKNFSCQYCDRVSSNFNSQFPSIFTNCKVLLFSGLYHKISFRWSHFAVPQKSSAGLSNVSEASTLLKYFEETFGHSP